MNDDASWPRLAAALGLPPTVALDGMRWTGDDLPGVAMESAGPLPAALAAASARRRSQYLAGRHCARRALRQAGAADQPVGRGDDGLPVVPPGWHLSISHAEGMALALAARTRDVAMLGVDIERWLTDATAAEVGPMVASPADVATLRATTGLDAAQAVTLLFSAKESLYKALYPTVRQFVDFDGACLASAAPGTLTLRLARDWHPAWLAGACTAVGWAGQADGVVTAVWQRAPLPPHGAVAYGAADRR